MVDRNWWKSDFASYPISSSLALRILLWENRNGNWGRVLTHTRPPAYVCVCISKEGESEKTQFFESNVYPCISMCQPYYLSHYDYSREGKNGEGKKPKKKRQKAKQKPLNYENVT